ncbi:MAG: Sua5/YciO/YrdC/YwlC family protein [Geminicoccaceae bacterium]|nr:Sua5/YciO/YrdC/YwlC family protein [Geminicoccaceae bacterium]
MARSREQVGGRRLLDDPAEIRARLEHALDLVVDSGPCGVEPTTVVDLSGAEPVVVRRGKGAERLLKFAA